jgi:hypothetical protein
MSNGDTGQTTKKSDCDFIFRGRDTVHIKTAELTRASQEVNEERR